MKQFEIGSPKLTWSMAVLILSSGLCLSSASAASLKLYAAPNSKTNSIVFEIPGDLYSSWQCFSNVSLYLTNGVISSNQIANRTAISNLVIADFVSQRTTNFALFASLYEPNNKPTDKGIGIPCSAMWLKGVYRLGDYYLCDIRSRSVWAGEEQYLDTLFTATKSASGEYFYAQEPENPGLELFYRTEDQEGIWTSSELLATNWSSDGYIATTNLMKGAPNPWVVWLPGYLVISSKYQKMVYGPQVTNAFEFNRPEDVVAAALSHLTRGETNEYLLLLHPDDKTRSSPYFQDSAAEYVLKNWATAKNFIGQTATVNEVVKNGSGVFVTFRCFGINDDVGVKDWLYLKPYGSEWRIGYLEENSQLAAYLMNEAITMEYAGPKVLPKSR